MKNKLKVMNPPIYEIRVNYEFFQVSKAEYDSFKGQKRFYDYETNKYLYDGKIYLYKE
jgi:3-phenylpropionate/cinnamic acid dioxygenase small subunit